MKNILMVAMTFFIMSCNKPIEGIATCVNEKIDVFKQETLCNNGSKVDEYNFEDDLVYVFAEGNCGADFQSLVINSTCDTLGWLGGLIGNIEINGVNFNVNSTFIQNVWTQ